MKKMDLIKLSIVCFLVIACSGAVPKSPAGSDGSVDNMLRRLTEELREDEVGWGIEVFTQRKTCAFDSRFRDIKNLLDPNIAANLQRINKKIPEIRTMGQALASTPDLIATTLQTVTTQASLNHIEFLILSRRSTIATRLSIWVAVVFGIIGMLSLVIAVVSIVDTRKQCRIARRLENELKRLCLQKSKPQRMTCTVAHRMCLQIMRAKRPHYVRHKRRLSN